MRLELQERDGRRGEFTATFKRFGTKPAYKGPPIVTLLFVDVRDSTDKTVTDHIWFTTGISWERLNLKPGEIVRFEARIRSYTKGYLGHRDDDSPSGPSIDYRLSHPSNIVVISRAGTSDLPLFK